MPAPMISVVIPTYNRAHCLGEAIDSVLCQSFQDFELIVVDDGSIDETTTLVEKYMNKIKLLCQHNGGASVARNTGIKAAQGEWIAFLDSDDTWERDKLEIQMEDLRKNPTAIAHMMDAEIICDSDSQNSSLFELRGLVYEFSRRPLRERPLNDVLMAQFFTPTWMVRNDLFKNSGYFNTTLKIYEDFDFLTRVALEGPFYVNCCCGVKVRRVHDDKVHSLSDLHQTNRIQSFLNLIHIYSRLNEDFRLTLEERNQVRRMLGGVWNEAAEEYRKRGEWGEFISALIHSFNAEPGSRSFARAFLTAAGLKSSIRKIVPLYGKEMSFRRSEIRNGNNNRAKQP